MDLVHPCFAQSMMHGTLQSRMINYIPHIDVYCFQISLRACHSTSEVFCIISLGPASLNQMTCMSLCDSCDLYKWLTEYKPRYLHHSSGGWTGMSDILSDPLYGVITMPQMWNWESRVHALFGDFQGQRKRRLDIDRGGGEGMGESLAWFITRIKKLQGHEVRGNRNEKEFLRALLVLND